MDKVLIITYYWPPSGGAGVQRWVKLSKYLLETGITPYILTVDEQYASYMQTDKSLEDDIPSDIKVYKTRSFEPIRIYEKLVGKKNVPTAGFSNVDNNSIGQKLINAIRSNLFIPDPRKGWVKYAYEKAVEIIKNENIDLVITSSPPHSSQLIGLKLKNKLGIKWVADLRDPWTDIYYYKILGHSFISKIIDQKLEKKVLINADRLIVVSKHIKDLFVKKDPLIDPGKCHIVPNGYDPTDFKDLIKSENATFTICYTGTMANTYDPEVFINALAKLKETNTESNIKLQMIGYISDNIKSLISNKIPGLELIPNVPHNEIVKYQKNADLLLLVIPDIKHAEGILTGKIFEYLASGNPIIGIGPENGDAAKIIDQCNAGKFFDRNKQKEITKYLENCINNFYTKKPFESNITEINKFSRKEQSVQIKQILIELNEIAL
jgi:glycosyltransferase involved in cell wall biosynthesis